MVFNDDCTINAIITVMNQWPTRLDVQLLMNGTVVKAAAELLKVGVIKTDVSLTNVCLANLVLFLAA